MRSPSFTAALAPFCYNLRAKNPNVIWTSITILPFSLSLYWSYWLRDWNWAWRPLKIDASNRHWPEKQISYLELFTFSPETGPVKTKIPLFLSTDHQRRWRLHRLRNQNRNINWQRWAPALSHILTDSGSTIVQYTLTNSRIANGVRKKTSANSHLPHMVCPLGVGCGCTDEILIFRCV